MDFSFMVQENFSEMMSSSEQESIVISQKLLRELMEKPFLYSKLFLWMIFRASSEDHEELNRGQFRTSITEMQEAMAYRVGYRKIKPSRDEIRGAYEAFSKASMISTAKTLRGLVITVFPDAPGGPNERMISGRPQLDLGGEVYPSNRLMAI